MNSSAQTQDALIEAWKAIHPSKTLSDECQALYLTFFTATAAAGHLNETPAGLTSENTTPPQPRACLPPPQRFQRRNRIIDMAPPGPAKPFDQSCTALLSALDATPHKQDDSDSNLEQILPAGPSET